MKKILITGTTQGIGKQLYERYKDSYEIYTINRRAFEGNNYICDLYDIEKVVEVSRIISELDIDILINNAGGAEPVLFYQMDPYELIACTNLNYHAPVLFMQAVLENMKNKNYGRIINISSIASKAPRPYLPHYGSAKSALEKFSSSMAVLYSGCGITINCICPGGIETDTSLKNRIKMAQLMGASDDFCNKQISTQNGLGRMIKPDELLDTIDFLLSDNAKIISGQTINVCGVREVH